MPSLVKNVFRRSSGISRRRCSTGLSTSRRSSGRLLKACICRVTIACFSGGRLLNVFHIWFSRARCRRGQLVEAIQALPEVFLLLRRQFFENLLALLRRHRHQALHRIAGVAQALCAAAFRVPRGSAAGDLAPRRPKSLRGGGGALCALAGLGSAALWAHIATAAVSSRTPNNLGVAFHRLKFRAGRLRAHVLAELDQDLHGIQRMLHLFRLHRIHLGHLGPRPCDGAGETWGVPGSPGHHQQARHRRGRQTAPERRPGGTGEAADPTRKPRVSIRR